MKYMLQLVAANLIESHLTVHVNLNNIEVSDDEWNCCKSCHLENIGQMLHLHHK